MKLSLQSERMLLNTELKVLTSKSRSASSWFCMIGRVFRSFSGFIVLITPSILQSKGHTFIRYRDLSTHCIVSTLLPRAKRAPFYGKFRNNCFSLSHPLQQEGSNTRSRVVLPSFHFGEVNCYKSIWKCFFIQVSAVSPNEGRHIIAWKLSICKLDILKGKLKFFSSFQELFSY